MKWQATSTSSKAFLMQFVDIFWVDMWLKGLRSDIKRWEDFLFVSILLKCLKNTNFENVWVSREIILLFRLGTFKSSAMMSHQWKIFKPSLVRCPCDMAELQSACIPYPKNLPLDAFAKKVETLVMLGVTLESLFDDTPILKGKYSLLLDDSLAKYRPICELKSG